MLMNIFRIMWKIPSEAYNNTNQRGGYGSTGDDVDIGEGKDDEPNPASKEASTSGAAGTSGAMGPLIDPQLNECVLLWQGVLPKRAYHTFKFQVISTSLQMVQCVISKSTLHCRTTELIKHISQNLLYCICIVGIS